MSRSSLPVRIAAAAAVAAPVVGIGVGAWFNERARRSARGRRRAGAWVALGGAAVLAVARWQLARLLVEQAPYKVEGRAGDLEIRLYGPAVHAETLVEDATWKDALSEGFRRVAGYIFGGNDRSAPIAMTAPVEASMPSRGSERIAMTAPVIATLGSESDLADRTVAFVMPKARSIDTLPKPKDPRVHLREVPARRVAVLRFRGAYGGSLPATKRAELLMRLRQAGLAPAGEATFAGYDPPSTLPWLRRNEVMVEVADGVPVAS